MNDWAAVQCIEKSCDRILNLFSKTKHTSYTNSFNWLDGWILPTQELKQYETHYYCLGTSKRADHTYYSTRCKWNFSCDSAAVQTVFRSILDVPFQPTTALWTVYPILQIWQMYPADFSVVLILYNFELGVLHYHKRSIDTLTGCHENIPVKTMKALRSESFPYLQLYGCHILQVSSPKTHSHGFKTLKSTMTVFQTVHKCTKVPASVTA